MKLQISSSSSSSFLFITLQLLVVYFFIFLTSGGSSIVVANAAENNHNNINDNGIDDEVEDDDTTTMVNVILGMKSIQDQIEFDNVMNINRRSAYSSVSNVRKSKRTPAVAVTLSVKELQELRETSSIWANSFEYIEEDTPVRRFMNNNNEQIPYGIRAVLQAETTNEVFDNIPLPPPLSNPNDDDDCFRVCVVDSGWMDGHVDLGFDRLTQSNRFNGRPFELPNGQEWYNPDPFTSNHGTHVTGTIFAKGNNDIGVIGVVPSIQGMCLSIARVFADGIASTTSTSAVNDAIEWCADQPGTRVINLSLGSGSNQFSSERIYRELYENEGILIVAAAGNGGLDPDEATSYQYPASYDHVISVAAVDENNDRAVFSQMNDQVDIAAPGVQVLSTAGGTVTVVDSNDSNRIYINGITERVMEYSIQLDPDDNRWFDVFNSDLELSDCRKGLQNCNDARDKVCLIERGDIFFWEKAISCQNGRGIMALIYNNEPGLFFGTLTPEQERNIDIPVFSLTRDEGIDMLTNVANGISTIRLSATEFGYSYLSGTSMASPHVAGVIARIWSARPECTNVQIEQAIMDTALDLGEQQGRDDLYGEGLIQGLSAYEYLLENFDPPCGGMETTDGNGNGGTNDDTNPDGCSFVFDTCTTSEDCCDGFTCRNIPIGGGEFSNVCWGVRSAANKGLPSRNGRGGAGGRAQRGGRRTRNQRRRMERKSMTTTTTKKKEGSSQKPNPRLRGGSGVDDNTTTSSSTTSVVIPELRDSTRRDQPISGTTM